MNIKISILFISVFAFLGCKGRQISSIPDYPVSMQINLAASYPTFKNSVNQYITIEKPVFVTDRTGFAGILICSGLPDSYGNSSYYAYDLACPVEAKREVKVMPLTDDLFKVKCEECGSEYDVGDGFGFPTAGEAKEPLKTYKATVNGDMLYVHR